MEIERYVEVPEVITPDDVLPPGTPIYLRKVDHGTVYHPFDFPTEMFAYPQWDAHMTQGFYEKYSGLSDFVKGRTGGNK